MRHRALGVALLLVLAISGGFACGETQETPNDPTVTAQQEADRTKARSEALQKRIEAQRQAREERAERIRAQRRDDRSPRQRCVDEELDSLGRAPSRLALRTIDLKCSQR